MDLMSEEEDATLDGRPAWFVQPPPHSAEQSTMCGALRQRPDMDQKYVAAVLIFGLLYILFSVLHYCPLQ